MNPAIMSLTIGELRHSPMRGKSAEDRIVPPLPLPASAIKSSSNFRGALSRSTKAQVIENRTKELQEDVRKKAADLQEARRAVADEKESARVKAQKEKDQIAREKRKLAKLNAELDELDLKVGTRLHMALERDAFFARESAKDTLETVQEHYDMATFLWGVGARELKIMGVLLDARDRLKRLDSVWKLAVEDTKSYSRAMARRSKDSRFRTLENLVELKSQRVEEMGRRATAVEARYRRVELDLVHSRWTRAIADAQAMGRALVDQEEVVAAATAAIGEAEMAELAAQLDTQAATDTLRLAQEADDRDMRRSVRTECLEAGAELECRRDATRRTKSQLRAARTETTRMQSEMTRLEGVVEVLTAQREALMLVRNEGVYVGDYRDNDRHGQGCCTYNNGDSYSGEWMDDLRQGRGTFRCEDGSELVAEWERGEARGVGTYSFLYGTFDLSCCPPDESGDSAWRSDVRVGFGDYVDAARNRYRGQWRGNSREGRGKMSYTNGEEYDGEWVGGQRCGAGRLVDAYGGVYEGEWLDNLQHNQGTYSYAIGGTGGANESKYVGAWKCGRRHGRGKLFLGNGDCYEGEFRNDAKQGTGTWTYADGASYSGEWEEGKKSGQGTLSYANGNVYFGSWRGDKRNGKGTHRWRDGSEYVGGWKEALREGKGRHLYSDGSVYDGEWQGGKRHGKGKFVAHGGDSYDGEWKANARHGHGKHCYSNGDVYEGDWQGGKRDGVGFYQYASCDTYKGEWKDDEINGQGTCVSATGHVFKGACRVPRGSGCIIYSEAEVSEVEWMGALEL